MVRITATVEGMMCAHCEAHVNEAVKKAIKVKSVEASAKHKECVIIAKTFDEAIIRSAIEEAGYKVTDIKYEEIMEEKGFFKKLFGTK